MSSNCWRRWAPVIRTRGRPALLLMASICSWHPSSPGHASARATGGVRLARAEEESAVPSGRRSGDAALGSQPHRVGPLDARGPAELLEGPDDPGTDVDLSAEDAVPGAGGVGVVQVVPRLAKAEQGQLPEVGRPVPRGERPCTHVVADRVDRP